jgi:thiamine biosynthesis lipoprotein
MKKILYLITTVIILFVILFIAKENRTQTVNETFLYFDTFIKLEFSRNKNTDPVTIREKVDKELNRIDSIYGYGANTLAAQLLKEKNGLIITSEQYYILKKCLDIASLTDGAFDITVGSLKRIWDFNQQEKHIPSKEKIEYALSKVDYHNIILGNSFVSLKEDKCVLDMGGIAKGYALDRIVDILKNEGITAGIVDAGGDLKIFGKKHNNERWCIGIVNPRKPAKIFRKIYIDSGAVATSGDYERYFIKDGIRYHHILNPKTGYPARKCISVTVVSETGIIADALATGIFVLGPQNGMELVKKINGVDALIMFMENDSLKIIKSRGINLEE